MNLLLMPRLPPLKVMQPMLLMPLLLLLRRLTWKISSATSLPMLPVSSAILMDRMSLCKVHLLKRRLKEMLPRVKKEMPRLLKVVIRKKPPLPLKAKQKMVKQLTVRLEELLVDNLLKSK